MKIYVAGNCQAGALAGLLESGTGLPVERLKRKGNAKPEDAHVIFCQPSYRDAAEGNVILFPRFVMTGFHPDIIFGSRATEIMSPLRNLNSSIILKAWCESLNVQSTRSLFCARVFEKLGFFDHFVLSKDQLFSECRDTGFPIEDHFEKWLGTGCFMHTLVHPKLAVMLDLARFLAARAGLDWNDNGEFVDYQERGCGWPFYPELAERVGLQGNYEFRMHSRDGGGALGLTAFIEQSFEEYAKQSVARTPSCEQMKSTRYANLRALLPAKFRGSHPYAGLPDFQFWRKSAGDDFDPVTNSILIRPEMKLATAGSCFAQHISRTLSAHGFNHFVAEPDPGTGGANYGVFSARFGNIYTAKQLLQLFDRAHGQFKPKEIVWRRKDRYVDPFRPEIEPDGFPTVQALTLSRAAHFEAVRRMFRQLDIFVFTLGLTEAWRAKQDGAVFPLAPGVAGGVFNADKHEFVNFGVADTVQDLRDFLKRLAKVNARARVILTVSPVPLAATFEPRHVLVSTTYSKSVLRVAAEEVARSHSNVTYFPSYEIVTGSFSRGRYFGPDLRNVTPDGVDHVMRVFLRHFAADADLEADVRQSLEIVCEEERLLDGEKYSAGRPFPVSASAQPALPAPNGTAQPLWRWLRGRLPVIGGRRNSGPRAAT